MAALLLVHSPLVGPSTWQPVAEVLRRTGHTVTVPTLAVQGPPYTDNLIRSATNGATDQMIVVAHSGAGALVPAIADKVAAPAAVFVDAVLPHPDTSWFETAPADLRDQITAMAEDGYLPPWHQWFPPEELDALLPDPDVRADFVAELRPLPVAYLAEPAPPNTLTVPSAYLQLSEAYASIADEAEHQGWWVHRTDADHLSPLTRPDRIARLLQQAITAIT